MGIKFASGSSQALTVANGENFLNFSGAFTINFWLKPDSADVNKYLFHIDDGSYQVTIQQWTAGAGLIYFSITTPGGSEGIYSWDFDPVSTDWWMLTCRRNVSNLMEILVDAVADSSTKTRGGSFSFGANTTLHIAQKNDATLHFDGLLAEMAIWDTGLSQAQLDRLRVRGAMTHRAPRLVAPSNLVAYWPMLEGPDGVAVSAPILRDHSGGGRNATAVNAPECAATPISTLGAGPLNVIAAAAASGGGALAEQLAAVYPNQEYAETFGR